MLTAHRHAASSFLDTTDAPESTSPAPLRRRPLPPPITPTSTAPSARPQALRSLPDRQAPRPRRRDSHSAPSIRPPLDAPESHQPHWPRRHHRPHRLLRRHPRVHPQAPEPTDLLSEVLDTSPRAPSPKPSVAIASKSPIRPRAGCASLSSAARVSPSTPSRGPSPAPAAASSRSSPRPVGPTLIARSAHVSALRGAPIIFSLAL